MGQGWQEKYSHREIHKGQPWKLKEKQAFRQHFTRKTWDNFVLCKVGQNTSTAIFTRQGTMIT